MQRRNQYKKWFTLRSFTLNYYAYLDNTDNLFHEAEEIHFS